MEELIEKPPCFDDIYSAEIIQLKKKVLALESKYKKKYNVSRMLHSFNKLVLNSLLVLVPVITIYFMFVKNYVFSQAILIFIGIAYPLLLIIIKKYLEEFSMRFESKNSNLITDLRSAKYQLDVLQIRKKAALDKFAKQRNEYWNANGEKIELLWYEKLSQLDEIKSSYLFRKPIRIKNEEQWRNWEKYNRIIESIDFKETKYYRFNNELIGALRDHFSYRLDRRINIEDNERGDLKTEQLQNDHKPESPNENAIVKVRKPANKSLENQQIDIIVRDLNDFLDGVLSKGIQTDPPDYTKKTKIGLMGEEFVLKEEQKKLKKIGFNENNYPIHVSKVHGDQFGFDILSLDDKLQPLMIEVKTTVNDSESSFFLTKNEKGKFYQYSDNYVIARVSSFDVKKKEGKCSYIGLRELENSYEMQEEVFKVYLNS